MARELQVPASMSQRAATRAAPPDAGGHLGSETRPQDPVEDPRISESDERHPPLHVDPSTNPPRGDATVKRQALYTILLFTLLILLGALAWLPFMGGAVSK